ncbi:hypothetical protein PO878_15275 [Iamia majanohamensis]|uniref:Uncharacterized protein n=1 Tax=Iamia majanohamensis TaxID=467976 RepID=A0AAE9Y7I9_9ACTN|nr:hypothetical protein [Iamia majanohamensis]WCO65863.1 hypothetical protein PO878_15275 [Iamia majanohamensis]
MTALDAGGVVADDRRRPLRGRRPLLPGEDVRLSLGLSVAAGTAIVAFFTFAAFASPDVWVPVIVVIFLVAASVPLCIWLSRGDQRLLRILLLALVLKMGAVGPRYFVNEVVYQGSVDATRYDQAGGVFIEGVAEGRWTLGESELDGFPSQTRFVGYVTGLLYLVFGTSLAGGYFVFSWVAWLGLLCFLQAFRIAFPNAPPYRAALLLTLFPALVFWPSSPGKDALMVFALGLATFGVVSLLYRHRPGVGCLLGALGVYLLWSVRPHVLLVVGAGLACALLARSAPRRGEQGASRSIGVRLVLLVLLVPALLLSLSRVDDALTGGDDEQFSLAATLDNTAASTEVGDSSFDTQGVRSVVDIPFAIVSVPLRPFPFEARSPQLALSSAEGVLLLALIALSARWIWMVGPAALRTPLGAFAAGYSLAFVIAFSNIGNAGILSRQRVQLFPLLFLLACAARALYDERLEARASETQTDGDRPRLGRPSPHPEPELAWSRT